MIVKVFFRSNEQNALKIKLDRLIHQSEQRLYFTKFTMYLL